MLQKKSSGIWNNDKQNNRLLLNYWTQSKEETVWVSFITKYDFIYSPVKQFGLDDQRTGGFYVD